jgi:hypothetical protein
MLRPTQGPVPCPVGCAPVPSRPGLRQSPVCGCSWPRIFLRVLPCSARDLSTRRTAHSESRDISAHRAQQQHTRGIAGSKGWSHTAMRVPDDCMMMQSQERERLALLCPGRITTFHGGRAVGLAGAVGRRGRAADQRRSGLAGVHALAHGLRAHPVRRPSAGCAACT